ncbi:DUF6777 domain-containing protein [Streptomyces tsukubensis]|uniref:DUF6777 domain-containing protein n=1 Tax=Streptomyces tsukubensis TaxID=83656 RepID=UPI0036C916D3
MSAEPPSSERPTGPPSGPLAGSPGRDSAPPPPAPESAPPPTRVSGQGPGGPGDGGGTGGGAGGGGGGDGDSGGSGGGPKEPGGEPGRPWWRSIPKAVLIGIAAAVVIAVVLLLTLPGGSGGSGSRASREVFLQAAGSTGPDPYTASTAQESTPPEQTARPTGPPPAKNTVRAVSGSTPGLYGGTQQQSSCDVGKQIGYLSADQAKNRAFAGVLGIAPGDVPGYLKSLTPVQLRIDTRVTNHGWRNGASTAYQAVLQAGTAVLVDARGVPRVRCACGNPLTPPQALQGTPKTTGDSWPGYQADRVVIVDPAAGDLPELTVYDASGHSWFTRPTGTAGGADRPTAPPAAKLPSAPPSASEEPSTAAPSSPGASKPASEPPSGQPSTPGSQPPPSAPATPGNSAPAGESPPPPVQSPPPGGPEPASFRDASSGRLSPVRGW